MRKQSGFHTESTIITALSVTPNEHDHLFLQRTLAVSGWVLYEANSLASALSNLAKHRVGLIFCERYLPANCTWVDMLERLQLLQDPPPLIVTSRHADETLWAEALNLGAYDVLAKPFVRQEVLRTANLAWLHWAHRHDAQAAAGIRLMTAAAG